MNAFSSAAYWEDRYKQGRTSGSGSRGRLAAFKAGFINRLVTGNRVDDVIDMGCGDGELLSMLQVPAYVGIDVSPTSLANCRQRFPEHRFVHFDVMDQVVPADLAMSIDVVFHLVEDTTYIRYMQALFDHARRFVLIYSSNAEAGRPTLHVRHRRFSDDVAATLPGWQLVSHVPNRYPFDRSNPDETSFADFFVYARTGNRFPVFIPDPATDELDTR